MARKRAGYGRKKAPTTGRVAPQQGGPRKSSFGPTDRRATGGWRNSKGGAAPTTPGTTDLSTMGPGTGSLSSAIYGGGGRGVFDFGPKGSNGSLAMKGAVVVKRPRAAASHFQSAQPAGGAARKVRKAKAPGK
jgi:hypothetical protein